jgi:hypothetical protein
VLKTEAVVYVVLDTLDVELGLFLPISVQSNPLIVNT